ncbi:MAG: glycosyltransferase [Bacteroidetes bacterium]|nr:glycosyltransferase [Bacteroidota bacterium]
MNYIIAPILYDGAGINDILKGLIATAKSNNVIVTVGPLTYGRISTFGLDNPKEYSLDCLHKTEFLLNSINDGDTIIFIDAFALGIDVLEYYLKRENLKVKKIGLLHGSSFIANDLYSDDIWLRYFEEGWFNIFDLIVCPSQYFIDQLPPFIKNKAFLSPWGIDILLQPEFENKSIDVIFPHRFSLDKGIEDFLEITTQLPDVNFTITGLDSGIINNLPNNLKDIYSHLGLKKNINAVGLESTQEHLKRLKSSKIVLGTAKQEGFGYSIFKAVQCGNIPVLSNQCCYPEFFDQKFIYRSIGEACEKINGLLSVYPQNYFYPNPQFFNFNNIIKLLSP